MQASESINELAAALAKAQGEFPQVKRDKTVNVKMKAGGTYTFSYAPLESILRSIVPCLSAYGLAVVQSFGATEGRPYVETRIIHSSGQWISCQIPVIVSDDAGPQELGSATTYARRYGVSLIVCMSADDDDDANAASGNTATVINKKDIKTPQSNLDAVKGDHRIIQYAARFRDVMDADEQEPAIAKMVYDIHTEITQLTDEHKHELYQAVADALPTKYRNAIKTYVAQHKRTL